MPEYTLNDRIAEGGARAIGCGVDPRADDSRIASGHFTAGHYNVKTDPAGATNWLAIVAVLLLVGLVIGALIVGAVVAAGLP